MAKPRPACRARLGTCSDAMYATFSNLIKFGWRNTPMLKFKCKDVGFDCGFTAKGKTEDEILSQCATHATKDHGMKPEEITEELKGRIKANIHKSLF